MTTTEAEFAAELDPLLDDIVLIVGTLRDNRDDLRKAELAVAAAELDDLADRVTALARHDKRLRKLGRLLGDLAAELRSTPIRVARN